MIISAALYGALISIWFPVGAWLVMRLRLTHHFVAAFMSIGAGLLIAAASIDLTVGAFEELGIVFATITLLGAAGLFSLANWILSRKGAKNRKRCGECVQQSEEDETPGSGLAIALGTVLDAIPEAIVLGVVITSESKGLIALVVALAIGNLAQSISSTAGLLEAGRSPKKVLGLWFLLAVLVIVMTIGSCALFSVVGESAKPWIEAFAAGILIAMTSEAMLPEAFDKSPSFSGLLAGLGICLFMIIHQAF